MKYKKNMKVGNKKNFIHLFFILIFSTHCLGDDKIVTSPLINLNEIKPSFEEVEDLNKNEINNKKQIQKKIKKPLKNNSLSAKFIGLDKITAKTSEITIILGKAKKFGPLEIKVLKCGEVISKDSTYSVAYLQVKDLSENNNERIFIFNGWTFSSDPTIAPFDHAIYDLQLVKCNNV